MKMGIDYFKIQLKNQLNLVIPLEKIAEVLSLQKSQICPIPGVHQALLGVINQRGQLLWIVDLNQLINSSYLENNRQFSPKLTVIVVSENEQKIGCIVDNLKGIVTQDEYPLLTAPNSTFMDVNTPLIISQSESFNLLNIHSIFNLIRREQAIGNRQ